MRAVRRGDGRVSVRGESRHRSGVGENGEQGLGMAPLIFWASPLITAGNAQDVFTTRLGPGTPILGLGLRFRDEPRAGPTF